MSSRVAAIVANSLSSLRLGLACVFPALPSEWRLPAMLAGGLSDWIDGLIARRFKATSAPGALLDAVADKLFTLSVLVTMLLSGEALWWQAVVVLARDVVVTMIACYALLIGRLDAFRHMRPRLPGKLATTAVFIWFVALLAGASAALAWWLFIAAACASAMAGLDYLLQFARRYQDVYNASAPSTE